jgi:hypothetical protein
MIPVKPIFMGVQVSIGEKAMALKIVAAKGLIDEKNNLVTK